MLETIRNAWKVQETRKKLLYTLLIIIIYRIGSVFIPAPFLDNEVLAEWMKANATGGNFLNFFNLLTGGNFSKATVFTLSIQPFIQASSTAKNPNSWFISFGGTDYFNLTEKALQAIHDVPCVESITVVIGDAYK